MDLTITITDPGDITFDELKQALTTCLEDNGVNSEDGNIEIEQSDAEEPDPSDVTQNPPMPPGGQGKQLRAGPGKMTAGGTPPGLGPMTNRPKSQ
jgi:hypothetical protein